nr:hypothetical protein [Tanacetum cinerariifolium]
MCGMGVCLSEYALMRMLSCLVEAKMFDVIMDVCLELGDDYKRLCAEPYGKFEEGHQVILIALDKGIFLDAVVLSSMIDAYVKQGNLKKGLEWGPLVGGRVKKVVVGRRRYGGVIVVEEVEWIKWIIWIMEPGILRIISTDDSNEVRIFGSWEESVEREVGSIGRRESGESGGWEEE